MDMDDDACYRALSTRDARFDGRLFVGVRTTGIYCRPICPARTPKRENVRFYPTAAAAQSAGFRPCLRCRPETSPDLAAWRGASNTVARALSLIESGALDDADVDALGDRLGVGERQLRRLFRKHLGASPIAVAQTRRVLLAKQLIHETRLPMAEVALASGFGSTRRFNDAFARTYRRPPRELRRLQRRGAPAAAVATAGELVLRLSYRAPYDFTQLLEFLAARAVPGVERVADGSYRRTVACGRAHALIKVTALPRASALALSVHGAPPAALLQIASTARRVFDLAADPARIGRELAHDELVGPLVRARPGLRIPGAWEPFECAVRAILGQQVSVAAARTFAARLVQRAGRPLADASEGLTHLFPSPAAVAAADLGDLGLTRSRVATLHALARAVLERRVDFSAAPQELGAALAALPGIGPWTAQYVLLRALGEPDALPSADLVLRRMAAPDERPLSGRQLDERARRWQPWRGYAVMHLWRAAAAGRGAAA